MHVAIAGAHGKIALRMTRLRAAEGDRGLDHYHEPPHELPAEALTFAGMCASPTEETGAIALVAFESNAAVVPTS